MDRLTISGSAVPDKQSPNAFLIAWISAQWSPLLSAAFPRLCLIGFTFAQPFLINRAIEFAVTPESQPYNNVGYGLIGAYVLVYSGLAVSRLKVLLIHRSLHDLGLQRPVRMEGVSRCDHHERRCYTLHI